MADPARASGGRAAAGFRLIGLALLAVLASSAAVIGPASAQNAVPATDMPAAPDPASAGQRAANLARMHAERLNGGLGVYRSEACMYRNRGEGCLIRRNAEGFLFRFRGGPPGWQQLGLAPTVVTELLISPDGTRVERVIQNEPMAPPAPAAP